MHKGRGSSPRPKPHKLIDDGLLGFDGPTVSKPLVSTSWYALCMVSSAAFDLMVNILCGTGLHHEEAVQADSQPMK